MAVRRFHSVVTLAILCVGAILSLHLLIPGVVTARLPFPVMHESGLETDAVPGNASENVSTLEDDPDATILLMGSLSDDERLEALIARTSIQLLEASVEQIYSAHARDSVALRDQATSILSLAEGARDDVATLEVSPELAPIQVAFITVLEEFVTAGTLLNGSTVINQSVIDEAVDHLARGTKSLADLLQEFTTPPAGSPGASPVPTSPATNLTPAFPDALKTGERFCYEDARGENSISLIVGTTKQITTFHTLDTKTKKYTTQPGNAYLLVAVKVTHLGYKGDGTASRLDAPRENAFTLHYLDETYNPISSPGPTNQGGSYSGGSLQRHESREGFLFFEVPEELDLSFAYLEARVGRGHHPVWFLGPG